jgi:hypothetical protein
MLTIRPGVCNVRRCTRGRPASLRASHCIPKVTDDREMQKSEIDDNLKPSWRSAISSFPVLAHASTARVLLLLIQRIRFCGILVEIIPTSRIQRNIPERRNA